MLQMEVFIKFGTMEIPSENIESHRMVKAHLHFPFHILGPSTYSSSNSNMIFNFESDAGQSELLHVSPLDLEITADYATSVALEDG